MVICACGELSQVSALVMGEESARVNAVHHRQKETPVSQIWVKLGQERTESPAAAFASTQVGEDPGQDVRSSVSGF